jgi:hypothetical protein
MKSIPNSRPNLKVTSKMPSKNCVHNFCTPFFDKKSGQKSVKIRQVKTVNVRSSLIFAPRPFFMVNLEAASMA